MYLVCDETLRTIKRIRDRLFTERSLAPGEMLELAKSLDGTVSTIVQQPFRWSAGKGEPYNEES